MKGIRPLGYYRVIITRSILIFFLMALLWRNNSYLLPHQLLNPELHKTNYDISYLFINWGFHNLLIENQTGALIFSITLITLCTYCILYPTNRLFLIFLSIFGLIYGILFNIHLTHPTHMFSGFTLVTFCFWPKNNKNFEILWDFLRYYVCWLYFSAFVWKILNKSIFQKDFGYEVFKNNLSEYIIQNENLLTGFYHFFLRNPEMLNIGAKIIILLEGAFFIGFLTKKYDSILIRLILIIHVSTYFFVNVFFLELFVFILPLISIKALNKIDTNLPFLNKSFSFCKTFKQ